MGKTIGLWLFGHMFIGITKVNGCLIQPLHAVNIFFLPPPNEARSVVVTPVTTQKQCNKGTNLSPLACNAAGVELIPFSGICRSFFNGQQQKRGVSDTIHESDRQHSFFDGKAPTTLKTRQEMAPGKPARQQSDHHTMAEELELFQRIFDNLHTGAMVTDAAGYVTHLNHPYQKFLGLGPDEGIGRHCTEVVENTRMHIVARTGKAEINQTQNIRGQNIIVHRIPIRKAGEVIAVFGLVMFQDAGEVVKLARKLRSLESQVKKYKKELKSLRATRYTLDSIIGNSRAIAELKQEVLVAATNDYPVLIVGESGTGKELFAQSIHHASKRAMHPFVQINCAAIPRDLLESELFGYERGAFTGARSAGKPGKFELAHRGTIFLDEIGDLPLEMQPKLLRVLEEKTFERVGGNTVLQSDFRLVAATNRDLEKRIREGQFRKDLYFRLNVMSLSIPPLRERREDIIPIARHLLRKSAAAVECGEVKLERAAAEALQACSWPGNVRELSNILDRAICSTGGGVIGLTDLPATLQKQEPSLSSASIVSIREVQANAERSAIRHALKKTGNNKALAARHLGIHRTLLYKKMRKYGISLDGSA
jgi:PAS domain S-box-containing protein